MLYTLKDPYLIFRASKDEYSQGRNFFRFNKDEHIVRLHIGLEDPKDLINDLKRSLRHIK